MADMDVAQALPVFVQPPVAIVSTSPGGLRTVVVTISPSAPILKTLEKAVSSGGPKAMSDTTELEKRLRGVETDVATIKERLNHMPTKAEIQSMLSGAQSKILLAIGAAVLVAVVKWTWPVLFSAFAAS